LAVKHAYISGPLQAARDLKAAREFYERLAEICVSVGISPYLPHQQTDPQRNIDASSVSVYRRDRAAIGDCDLLLAEIGPPSSGVGAELALALTAEMPVIAVHHLTEQPSRFVLGMLEDYELAVVISYDNVDSLAGALSAVLEDFAKGSKTPLEPRFRTVA
jgi:nucleoside 2-deoxyribosyltransferase